MAHEIAKLLLEHAETFLERTEAIRAALSLGMPLNEIEEYLDWLDAVRGKPRDDASDHAAQQAREAPPASPISPSPPPDLTAGQGTSSQQPPTTPAKTACPDDAAPGPHPKAARSRPAEESSPGNESQPPSASRTPPASPSASDPA
jgi:hypothetical protein